MRLTQEQAAAVDAKAERDDVHVLAPDRILDLRDQLRDTTARAEQAERGDVAWLVERESRPRWWTGRINATGYREWTDESLEAIRFARREDAEAMIRHLSIEYGSKATHHAWTDAPARATPAEGGAA